VLDLAWLGYFGENTNYYKSPTTAAQKLATVEERGMPT
jgi:hypothetical protein